MKHITTLLFDLGGVLIELGDINEMMVTARGSPETKAEQWLASPTVREFESGNCDETEFAENMIAEFRLSLSKAEFLVKFGKWPKRTFPMAKSLLEMLSGNFQLICLSNSNKTHFENFLVHQPIINLFTATFFSHETGLLKPDLQAFENVLSVLSLDPHEVFFFDDNAINVEAARAVGIAAERVESPYDAKQVLIERMILIDSS